MARKTTKKSAAEGTPQTLEQVLSEAEWSEKAHVAEHEIPRRRDLLVEAIRGVRMALTKETTPSRTSIGNLVQLLRLHKELIREEERPTQIQLVWNEVDEELHGDD